LPAALPDSFYVQFSPLEEGKVGFEFSSEVKGGSVPKEYIPGVMKVKNLDFVQFFSFLACLHNTHVIQIVCANVFGACCYAGHIYTMHDLSNQDMQTRNTTACKLLRCIQTQSLRYVLLRKHDWRLICAECELAGSRERDEQRYCRWLPHHRCQGYSPR
jgi:hypothetical protein